MAARKGKGALSSRCAVLILALSAVALSFAAPSYAQERERIGLLNRLFGSPAYRIEEPRREVARPRAEPTRRNKAEPAQRKKRPRVQREGAEPQVAVVTKRPDARVVLVVGDFLGSGLAEGLTTVFMQNPNFRIVDRTSGSSGFVREDFHNWPEKVDELITKERPAAIVVMIGANDRQQMLVDGVRETVRSQAWNKEYAARAAELANAISARKVPFLWVGMPPFKSSKTMLDMLVFNDIYRAAAASAGGEYVDIWDGFVDENGAYAPSGPDINGQPARLRANDGINLARPGKRKVAFYAEKPLYKLLGIDPTAPASAATALSTRPAYRIMGPWGPTGEEEPSNVDVVIDPNELGPLDPARPVALRTPALDGGVELLGAVAEPKHEARTPAEKLAIEGIGPAPVTGRADQFAGPRLASAATAMRAMSIDRTLNKLAAPSALPDPIEDRAKPRGVRSDILTAPRPEAPLPVPPSIQPDRLQEISPVQAAPAIASAVPPLVTPATIDKAIVPNAAASDPLDMAQSRGAPLQSYKRPKSIGPGPTRAPTAVPQPVMAVPEPAGAEAEIPAASNADGAAEAEAIPATPDTAPAKSPAPSSVPGLVDNSAPARAAPRKANPVPVAALPATKDAPTELLPAGDAPAAVAAPSAPAEKATGVSVAKAAPSDPDGSAPGAKSVPASDASAQPAGLPDEVRLVTPIAPAAPSVLPASPAVSGSGATAVPEIPAATESPAKPATPLAPAAPTVLPEKADTPAAPASRRKSRRDAAAGGPADQRRDAGRRTTPAPAVAQEPPRRNPDLPR